MIIHLFQSLRDPLRNCTSKTILSRSGGPWWVHVKVKLSVTHFDNPYAQGQIVKQLYAIHNAELGISWWFEVTATCRGRLIPHCCAFPKSSIHETNRVGILVISDSIRSSSSRSLSGRPLWSSLPARKPPYRSSVPKSPSSSSHCSSPGRTSSPSHRSPPPSLLISSSNILLTTSCSSLTTSSLTTCVTSLLLTPLLLLTAGPAAAAAEGNSPRSCAFNNHNTVSHNSLTPSPVSVGSILALFSAAAPRLKPTSLDQGCVSFFMYALPELEA